MTALLVSAKWFIAPTDAREGANFLLLGNSYSAANDLRGMIRAMLEENGVYDVQGSRFEELSNGGYFLANHYDDAVREGSTLNNLLDGSIPWNWIVLQEQSQVSGLWRADNLKTAVDLASVVRASSSSGQVIFMMTWGRRNGDPSDLELYPDFLTMNARLESGYRRYVSASNSLLAPVGLAFQFIYNTDLAGGGDPSTDSSSNFYQLYNNDGSHPSINGSYLAACVLYQVMTGSDPRSLTFTPSGINENTRAFLQQSAYETVLAEADQTLSPLYHSRVPVLTPPSDLQPGGGPSVISFTPSPFSTPSTPIAQPLIAMQPGRGPSLISSTPSPYPTPSTPIAQPVIAMPFFLLTNNPVPMGTTEPVHLTLGPSQFPTAQQPSSMPSLLPSKSPSAIQTTYQTVAPTLTNDIYVTQQSASPTFSKAPSSYPTVPEQTAKMPPALPPSRQPSDVPTGTDNPAVASTQQCEPPTKTDASVSNAPTTKNQPPSSPVDENSGSLFIGFCPPLVMLLLVWGLR